MDCVFFVFHLCSAPHPQAAYDLAHAVKWIRNNIRSHIPEANPNKIFLSGHSAGGHLVSLLATDRKSVV